jgi:hypothetical protein
VLFVKVREGLSMVCNRGETPEVRSVESSLMTLVPGVLGERGSLPIVVALFA